ncbi:hypothetical protein N7478_000379 [Penicillium angulare]|uniref:uncharacterized protein n=1 Tax=Penicillium angulare TaxID=116970 RepID=UPI002541CFD2|nr:uncharacterized protein N7478_000379 [Penicillium angulare]KAJ5291128.1 hypothetical protein N7478_000379 [Penicillium angulare]
MIESRYQVDIPYMDMTSFVFSTGTPSSHESPQYFDADVPSKCFTMAQAKVWVKQFAKGLQDIGLDPNGKVLLFSENRFVLELHYQIKDSEANILLVGQKQVSVALEAARQAGIDHKNVYLFCDPKEEVPAEISSRIAPWTSIWRPSEEVQSWSWNEIDTREDAEGTTAITNYSSGKTGLPKAVEISHYNIVANCTQLLYKRPIDPNTQKSIERKKRLAISGERWLAPLPMYHAYGQAYYCVNAAILQAKVFITKSFSVQKYLMYMDIYRVTFMATVPAIMATISKQPNPSIHNLRAIETVLSGSAPLSPDLGFAPDDEDDGSIGWLNPNRAARIDRQDDRDFGGSAPQGATVGEIWVAGPNIMKGYYKKLKETGEAIVVVGCERVTLDISTIGDAYTSWID